MSKFDKIAVLNKIGSTGMVPVFYHKDAEVAKKVVKACYDGGVRAFEFTNRPDEREPFRKTDVVSFGCQGHFIGEGPQGYLHACIWLAQLLRTDGSSKAHIVM